MVFKRIWQAGVATILIGATAGTVALAADSLSRAPGATDVGAVQLASDDDRRSGDDRSSGSDSGPSIGVEGAVAAVTAAGYTDVREVEREGPDYEVKARDADGRLWEIYVDARTGEIVDRERD